MFAKNPPLRAAARALVVIVLLAAAAMLVYQIPAVHDRLSWRLDFAAAFARGIVNPVKPLPTPRVVQAAVDPAGEPAGAAATATPTLPAASPTPSPTPDYTPTITLTPTTIPASAQLDPPPWVKQDLNNCGPATLTMYLSYYGWSGDQQLIAADIKPIPEDRNVNVEELVYFARNRAGWLQIEYRVGGDVETLKKLLAAGIPVMIEEEFIMHESYWPNDDRWAGHYLLLTGYDDARGLFNSQDVFVGPNLPVSYQDLDKRWQTFNRVYILLFPPEKAGDVQSILGDDWDADHNRVNALEQSQRETEQDPNNAFAWFNLGTNLVYFDRYDEAAKAYDQARNLGLPQRMLRYQFGPFMAYFHSLRTDDLMTLTEYALKITPTSEEGMLWRGWGLFRLGRTAEAIALFQNALVARPGYSDAQYALDFVQQQ
jgi:tetratricopeptide (TPR) repeat protein